MDRIPPHFPYRQIVPSPTWKWVMMAVLLFVSGCAGRQTRAQNAEIPSAITESGPGSIEQIEAAKPPADLNELAAQMSGPMLLGPETSFSPRTIRNPQDDTPWSMELFEAVSIAMQNNPVIVQNAQFLSNSNPVLTSPDQTPSVFDVPLQFTESNFGNRSTQAAQGDFDPRLTSSMTWGRNEQVQNNLFLGGGLPPGATLQNDTANFDVRLEKTIETGATVAVTSNVDYLYSNQPNLLFDSVYTGDVGLELRQPLLAGGGVLFNEVAGPIANRARGATLAQGIRIAQISERVSTIDFEIAVRNLVREVYEVYWQLYEATEKYKAEQEVLKAAELVFREAEANEAALGGAAVAQAEATMFEVRARAENSRADIYEAESRLRRLLGMPIHSTLLIKPVSDPVLSDVPETFEQAYLEALQQRPELQRQKLLIQSLQLQTVAAQYLLLPQLDVVGGYRVNAFGDKLISRSHTDGVTNQGYRSAVGTLLDNHQTGWNLGLVLSMPLGFRTERSQLHNLELKLSKARAMLTTQEKEIGHELAVTFQNSARWLQLVQTNGNRKNATERQVKILEADYRAGRADRQIVDQLLRARQNYAIAVSEYVQSVANYNRSLAEIHYRSGRILAMNNITLMHR